MSNRSFFEDQHGWCLLRKRIARVKRLILLLDYDGTLVPIQPRPSLAVLDPAVRRLLRGIVTRKNLRTAVVTGRSLSDIRSLIHIDGIPIIANHGFEMMVGGRHWVHPAAQSARPLIQRLARELSRRIHDLPGVDLENKHYVVSVHFRNALPITVRRLKHRVGRALIDKVELIGITAGKKVIELRPRVAWNKGKAVLMLLQRWNLPSRFPTLYIGDDATDEDVFRLLPSSAFTIRVGKSARSHARFHVRDPAEVHRLLRMMNRLVEHDGVGNR